MIALPLITAVVIFCYYWVSNNKHFGIVNLLILAYVLMCSSALVLEQSPILQGGDSVALEPMAYMSICFIIVFWGFAAFKDRNFRSIKIERFFLYRILEGFLIVGNFGTILFFLPDAVDALRGDISLNRMEFVATGSRLAEFGIINSAFSLMANLFIISQVCSFINLIPMGGKRNLYKAYLLAFGSLSFVVYVLSYVGRDGFVYWVMSYIFCFVLFREFLGKNDLRRAKRLLILMLGALIIPFFMISAARFSEMPGGTLLWIVNYAGMQLRSFSSHYQIEASLLYGKHTLPIVYDFLNMIGVDVSREFEVDIFHSDFLSEGVEPWIFTTFIGDLMYDFGKAGTLVFLCIMSVATRILLAKMARTGVLKFSNMLIVILLYQLVFWGVFYFRLYVLNYYMLSIILLCLGFKVLNSSRFSLVYWKGERDSRRNKLVYFKESGLGQGNRGLRPDSSEF